MSRNTKYKMQSIDGVKPLLETPAYGIDTPQVDPGTSLSPLTAPNIVAGNGYYASDNFVSGSDGWQIKGNGDAEFNNITARGTIYATLGEIGGWVIATETLSSALGNVVLDSANEKITVGGIEIDGGNNRIQTTVYTSGLQGFSIDPTLAEFNNINVRGSIKTSVMEYNQVQVSAGTREVWKSGAKLLNDVTVVASPTTFNVDVADPDSGHVQLFSVGDILRIKDGANDTWMTIQSVSDQTTYYRYVCVVDNGTLTTYRSGGSVIDYGQSGQGGIKETADGGNAPYYSIMTHLGSPWSSLTEKVRLGKLSGITDALFGSLSGYGLWTDNIYLTGSINASGGRIGGFEIGSEYIRDTDDSFGMSAAGISDTYSQFLYPLTAVDDASVGTKAWVNVTNVKANDGSNATISQAGPGSGTSHYIKVSNLDFQIPLSATILGVKVYVEKGAYIAFGLGGGNDNTVKLVKAGSIVGDNKAEAGNWSAGSMSTSIYGGASDLWGTTLTPDDVNDEDFGVVFNADIVCVSGPGGTINVDYIRVEVTYALDPVRFYAGSQHNDREVAAFRVYQNGDVVARNIRASNIKLYDVVVSEDEDDGDFTDIQSAIDYLKQIGGTIFIRQGTYNISSPIQISKSNITIIGEKKEDTIIYLSNSSNDNMIEISSVSNIAISGIQLNGNKANNSTSNGIDILSSSDIIISDCKFTNLNNHGISGSGVTDSKIINNEFNSCGSSGVSVYGAGADDTGRFVITNNIFNDCGNDNSVGAVYIGRSFGIVVDSNIFELCYFAIYIDGVNYYCLEHVITNNIIKGSYEYSIVLYDNTGEIRGCIISNNNIRNGSNYAIYVATAYGTNVISDNMIYNTINGIYLFASDYNTVNDNQIYLFDDYGIHLNGGSYNTINGNNIKDSGATACIFLRNTSTDNIINGNVMIASGTYGYRENGSADDRNIVTSNRATGASSSNISIQGASTISANNITT